MAEEALIITAVSTALADDVLFVKNNFKHRLYIKGNGEWQGYVDPGKVAYMPQEGFVTENSGFQEDGTLKMEHTYGGWPILGEFVIEGVSAVFEEEGVKKVFYSKGSRPYASGYKQWGFGYGADGEISVPSALDTESAEKMRRGRPPREALDLVEQGVSPVKTSSGIQVTGLMGENKGGFPLQLSGSITANGIEKIAGDQSYDAFFEDDEIRSRSTQVGVILIDGTINLKQTQNSVAKYFGKSMYSSQYEGKITKVEGDIAYFSGKLTSSHTDRESSSVNKESTVTDQPFRWRVSPYGRKTGQLIEKHLDNHKFK